MIEDTPEVDIDAHVGRGCDATSEARGRLAEHRRRIRESVATEAAPLPSGTGRDRSGEREFTGKCLGSLDRFR